MKNPYFIPAATMIAALVIWLTLAIMAGTTGFITPWWVMILCLVTGLLVVFSSDRCRRVGGPRKGAVARTVILLVMAGYTWWQIDSGGALILSIAAVLTGIFYFLKHEPQGEQDPPAVDDQEADQENEETDAR